MNLNGGFPILYADPPWEYDNPQDHDPARGGTPYPQLSIRDICSLRPLIDKVVAKDCSLLLWATCPKLPEAMQVMAAWGFKFTTVPIVWVKLNPKGELIIPEKSVVLPTGLSDDGVLAMYKALSSLRLTPKDMLLKTGIKSGQGYWANGNVEMVLMGKRGRPKRYAKDVKQPIFSPVTEHSAKPEEARRRINRIYGDIPGLELFARPPKIKGWLKLGDEIDGLDIREALKNLGKGD